jgi:hypothetical protein
MRRRTRFLMLHLVLWMVFLYGCATRPVQVMDSLSLMARPPLMIYKDHTFEVTYRLVNDSAVTVEGCMSFASGYDLWTTSGIVQNIEFADHPVCRFPFTLRPFDEVEWIEKFEARKIGYGDAVFSGWVKVIVTGSCGQYGCEERLIRAPREHLIVSDYPS